MSEIKDQLDHMNQTLTEVRDSQIRHSARHEAIEQKLDEHHVTLFGNGKRGLKAQVARHTLFFALIVGLPTAMLIGLKIYSHIKEMP